LGYHVTATSRSKEIEKSFRIYSSEVNNKNFRYINFDINNSSQIKNIFQYIKFNKINKIVDFASQSMVGESWDRPLDWINTNCVGKMKLIEALLKLQTQLKFKFIRISTPEVYGSNNYPVYEENKFFPSTPYAVTQATADYLFKIYSKFKKLNVTTLRFANFYGPGQQLYRIIPKTITSILFKKKLKIHGNGNSIRSFIFSNDFSSAIINSLKFGKRGETYNISPREVISIKNLVKKICNKMEYSFDDLVYFSKDRLAKDQKYLLSSKKSKKELKWENNYSLNDGLDQTIKWYKDQGLKFKFKTSKYTHKR
jgi:dTDP-glucose 4,6-dehydratase